MTEDDVDLLLEFLFAEEAERRRIVEELRGWLARRDGFSAGRHSILCRRPLGLYVLLPWQIAAWLADTLEQNEDELRAVRKRMANHGWK